ncbi:MAG: hypothetical protein LH649_17030 [Pseudanabaena sp. CAN_BIN31]|nr:hypothetical protein [Pseudanabaena sp. CAN_BIN31]
MTFKERLIEELNEVPDALIVKVIDFLHTLKKQEIEDYEDIADAHAALATIETEGTVSWDDLKVEIGV